MDGGEKMKENKLPPEEGGVSRRGKLKKERSERDRSILDGLPVITILCLLELFSFFFFKKNKTLKTIRVSFPYIHCKMISLSDSG